MLGLDLDGCADAAKVYLASDLDVADVDAYRKALDVSEADAAALWASRSEGPLWRTASAAVAAALGRCAS